MPICHVDHCIRVTLWTSIYQVKHCIRTIIGTSLYKVEYDHKVDYIDYNILYMKLMNWSQITFDGLQ